MTALLPAALLSGLLLGLLLVGCSSNTQEAGVGSPERAASQEGIAIEQEGSGAAASGTAAETEILWDEWGVPHIFAADADELFHAHGWAQARAHGDLLLRLYAHGRGIAASMWGEEALAADRWVHAMGIPERAERWYDEQPEEMAGYLDAFAAGINDYAAAHPESLEEAVRGVLPVDGADVLAHLQRSIHFTFIANMGYARAARQSLGGEGGGGGALAVLGEGIDAELGSEPGSEPGSERWADSRPGSNAWAVAPSRSESGNALLLANPHLPWSDLFTWFEVQLTSPELDAYGATLVGTPFLGIAFNDHLGWTHTVNTLDGVDLYRLTLSGDGYLYDGEVKPFTVDTKEIAVRGADGSVTRKPFPVKHSVHGPVIAESGGEAVALRVVGLDASQAMAQYWEMMRATDLASFEKAQSRLQMPLFTTMYADVEGRILHLFGGITPKRPVGDWPWDRIVSGDTSETLWTETHVYGELPRVVDPESGWLQNANDPPWTTTFPAPLDPEAYPPYMAPRFMHFRAQSSARLLETDSSLTLGEMITAKHSTRMEAAVRLLDDLEAAVRASSSAAAGEAWEVLAAWDRRADAGSRGAVLFATFFRELMERTGGDPYTREWSEWEPRVTPDGLADPAEAVAALEAAAEKVRAAYGALDAPWGDVHRLRRGTHDLPANGGAGSLGIFRVVDFVADDDGRFTAVGGDSYVAAIEMSRPVRARALLSYGNWSQAGSPHVGDQLELFARGELRPVWRERAEVEAHLAQRESPQRR